MSVESHVGGELKIYNMRAKLERSNKLKAGKHLVSLSGMRPGLYLLKGLIKNEILELNKPLRVVFIWMNNND